MTSKRKAYVRGMSPSWWQKLGIYRFYMLREGTSVPAVWFSVILMCGVFSLKNGPEGWESFVGFLQNPLVMLINIIALLAAGFQTKTWFDLAPKATIIVVKDEKMGPEPIIKGLWVVTIVVTLAILAIALLF